MQLKNDIPLSDKQIVELSKPEPVKIITYDQLARYSRARALRATPVGAVRGAMSPAGAR